MKFKYEISNRKEDKIVDFKIVIILSQSGTVQYLASNYFRIRTLFGRWRASCTYSYCSNKCVKKWVS